MRNEELAKLNRVVLKYEVKDSTERSDFAVVGSCPKYCRGRRPRRPASLDGSTAISFVLSAQCCSAQILDILNLVTSSGTSHFCETEIEPFPYNVLVNFLLPQNRCRSLRIYVALRNKKAVQI